MPRFQRKLVYVLSLLVLVIITLTGVLAERGLRQRVVERTERSLVERAELIAQQASLTSFDVRNVKLLDALADASSLAARARVTLMTRDGVVVGDSEVAIQALAGVENHANRPEMQAALRSEIGRSTRRSATLKRDLIYVAVAVQGDRGGVVRLAVEPRSVEEAVAELRNALIWAAFFGIVASVVFAMMLARQIVRPLAELHDVVVGISEGKLDRRLQLWTHDEVGELGLAINNVAEAMRDQLNDTLHEKERLEAVVGSMTEGVLVLDVEGRVTQANPRLRELLNAWGEIEGRPWFELIPQPEAEAAIREAIEKRALVTCDLHVRGAEERWLQLHAVGFPAEGARAGTVLVLHDVTEMRRLDEVRRDFIANASHELKTPLTAIRGFSETVASCPGLDEETRGHVSIIARNAERMEALVEDLLTLSRIEGRRVKIESVALDPRKLIETILANLAPRLQQQSIEAVLAVDGFETVYADPGAVEQVLNNLLDNALKYTDAGGRIDISAEVRGSHLAISVVDSGVGIPTDDLGRIFERFYRVDAARSRALGGTGLGLSIVKHLVQSMGGEIQVESEYGHGSHFTFTLPTKPIDGTPGVGPLFDE